MFFCKHCWGVLPCQLSCFRPSISFSDGRFFPLSCGNPSEQRHSLKHPWHRETLNMSNPWLITKEGSEFHGKSVGELSYLNISHVLQKDGFYQWQKNPIDMAAIRRCWFGMVLGQGNGQGSKIISFFHGTLSLWLGTQRIPVLVSCHDNFARKSYSVCQWNEKHFWPI